MSVWTEHTTQIKTNPETWRVSYMVTAETSEKAEKRVKGILKVPGRNNIVIKGSKWKRSYGENKHGHRYYRVIVQYER